MNNKDFFSVPRQFLSTFESFTAQHNVILARAEAVVQNALAIIPFRLSNGEVTKQTISTLLSLFGVYRKLCVIRSTFAMRRVSIDQSTVSSMRVRSLTFASVLENIAILAEMIANRSFAEKGKWRIICLIELVRAIAQFSLLIENNGEMLTTHSLSKNLEAITQSKQIPIADLTSNVWEDTESKSFTQSLFDRRKLVTFVSESIYIIKPVCYAVGVLACGQDSWKPWIGSLLLDISSLLLAQIDENDPLEKEEFTRRFLLLFLYPLRSPAWDSIMEAKVVQLLQEKLSAVPFLWSLLRIVPTFVSAFRHFHFNTSCI